MTAAVTVADNEKTTSSQIAVTISIPVIHDFYTHLCRRGKHTLVAAIRKLLIILTAVIWDQVPWQPNRVLAGRHIKIYVAITEPNGLSSGSRSCKKADRMEMQTAPADPAHERAADAATGSRSG